jgi:putative peptidoglycan lipid II flippase
MTDAAHSDAASPDTAGSGTARRDGRLARDAMVVTACTMLSRVTGFARVLIAASVLSNGLLGDTYHSANLVPNLLFELVAGGVLQAVLVPTFVAARRDGGDQQLGRVAGAVVGILAAGLAAIAALVMVVSPLIAWALTRLEDDPQVASDKRRLITVMLLVFIPQIVFYGIGMVATAALAARRRFAAAALAPAVNNAVVITCYLLFDASRDGAPASLDLTRWQFTLLAGGTTLAVVAFTAVPGIVLVSQGVRWRPRWDPAEPAIARARASFGWAMLAVVGTIVPTGAAMVLGQGAEGGVAVFTFAFAFFALPHALLAVPVAVALAPRVAEHWQQGHRSEVATLVGRSVRVLVAPLLVSAAAMVALAWPIARAVSFGQAASQGLAPIAHALAAFGAGLFGYGIAFVMTRVLFSIGDVRWTAIAVSGAAVAGVVLMAVTSKVMAETDRAAALAIGFGAAQAISAVLLTWRVHRLTGGRA